MITESPKHFETECCCCGNFNEPGLAVDFDLYNDYSQHETSQDQARIEAVMQQQAATGSTILHVGIGNSELAKTFYAAGHRIDGVTVNQQELDHAQTLNLPRYRVLLTNKYHRKFTQYFDSNTYDYVVDNNPASFACCQYHFYCMIENYLTCLKPGGQILTDQRGMDWALLGTGFILDFASLSHVLAAMPVTVKKVSGSVYAIEKQLQTNTRHKAFSVYAKRQKEQGSYVEVFEPVGQQQENREIGPKTA